MRVDQNDQLTAAPKAAQPETTAAPKAAKKAPVVSRTTEEVSPINLKVIGNPWLTPEGGYPE